MPQEVYTLDNTRAHRRIVVSADEVGGRVSLVQGSSAGEPPQILARPSDDNGAAAPWPAGQCHNQAIMFTEAGTGVGNRQQIQVTFDSDVAGFVFVDIDLYLQHSQNDPDYYWRTGNFTGNPGNSSQQRQLRVTLNGVVGTALKMFGPAHGQESDPNEFRWYSSAANLSASSPQRYPVSVGSNTITIEASVGTHGEGNTVGAVAISYDAGDAIANGQHQAGAQTCRDVAPGGTTGWNLAELTTAINQSASQRTTLLACGSSLTVRTDNWLVTARSDLQQTYGLGGLLQRAGTEGSSTYGRDLSIDASWLTAATQGLTFVSASGGADYNGVCFGGRGYQWTDSQTGSMDLTVPAGAQQVRIVYRTYAAGSTLTIRDGSTVVGTVDTTGTDDRFGSILVDVTPGQTLQVAKETASGAAGVAAFVTYFSSSGLIVGRLCQNGNSEATFIAPLADATASYIAACHVDITLWDIANEQPSGNNSETRVYLADHNTVHNALRPSGGVLAIVDLFGYTDVTVTASLDDWADVTPTTLPDWWQRLVALADTDTDILDFQPAFLSGFEALGGPLAYQALYEAGGFATQSDDGVTATIGDRHTSAAGGALVGSAVAGLLTALATNSSTSGRRLRRSVSRNVRRTITR